LSSVLRCVFAAAGLALRIGARMHYRELVACASCQRHHLYALLTPFLCTQSSKARPLRREPAPPAPASCCRRCWSWRWARCSSCRSASW
jgi:hypothetical protein